MKSKDRTGPYTETLKGVAPNKTGPYTGALKGVAPNQTRSIHLEMSTIQAITQAVAIRSSALFTV